MENIQNKIALVTGGADGLGRTFVEKLLQNGAKAVAILDMNTNLGEKTATKLEGEFGKGRVMFLPCDVTNSTRIRECFKQVVDTFKGLDILINNAGILHKNVKKSVDVNLTALIDCSFVAMDYMGKHKGGNGGTILNVASTVGISQFMAIPVYAATKHGVVGFSLSMQASYPKTGVRFLTLCPGVTNTNLVFNFDLHMYDFIDKTVANEEFLALPPQTVENVGRAMIEVIQKGKNGAIVVAEADQPIYAVKLPHYNTLATPLLYCYPYEVNPMIQRLTERPGAQLSAHGTNFVPGEDVVRQSPSATISSIGRHVGSGTPGSPNPYLGYSQAPGGAKKIQRFTDLFNTNHTIRGEMTDSME